MGDSGASSNVNPFLPPQAPPQDELLINPFFGSKPSSSSSAAKQQQHEFAIPPPTYAMTIKQPESENINLFLQEKNNPPKVLFPAEIANTLSSSVVNPFGTGGKSAPAGDEEEIKRDFIFGQPQLSLVTLPFQSTLSAEPVNLSTNSFQNNPWAQQQQQLSDDKHPWLSSSNTTVVATSSINSNIDNNPFLQRQNDKKDIFTSKNKPIIGSDITEDTKTVSQRLGSANTIQLNDVPKKYFAKEFLSSFYSNFGVIIKVELKASPISTAFVTFVNHESAKTALMEGTYISDGEPPIEITWPSKGILAAKPNPAKKKSQAVKRQQRPSLDDFKASLREYAESLGSVRCAFSREKYELLDKLDKKIREGLQRDPKEYKALIGTCLEMCSEKERYFRDDKCQCSFFEVLSSDELQAMPSSDRVINPLKAVKEYSRSSADQEVPLPHELRHVTAIKQTLDYLILNIMDTQYANVAEWFDFLWNRTRAIRKDITQQNLKCITSIDCVEKCTRFHIFCSHYLCEQEMHIFDVKINLENLTKCLQTLKHMYEDFWRDQQTTCSNEAEFRGYQVLLNLNNGDTLREVMAFSPEVRNSEPVKFALKVFSAVQENNYSRFFKLLKKATFLNACLMHPYFTQVRSIALKRMARAFSVPKTDTPYPIQHIQKIFLFNDMETAAEFCNHFGFITDNFDVFLNRTSYMTPDEHYSMHRSDIILDKCQISMGEVINGGNLLSPVIYEPLNSFTIDGYYVGNYHELNGVPDDLGDEEIDIENDAFQDVSEEVLVDPDYVKDDGEDGFDEEEADDDEIVDDVRDKDYTDSHVEVEKERPVMILREDITNFSVLLVDELIHKVTNNVFNDMLSKLKENIADVKPFLEFTIAVYCIEESKVIAMEVLEEMREEKKKEEVEMLEAAATSFRSEFLNRHIDSILLDISIDVHMEAKKKKNLALIQTESEALQRYLLNATLLGMISDIAVTVHKNVSLEKKEFLLNHKEIFERKKLQRYFHQWIKAYKYHVFVKTTLAEFPAFAPSMTKDVIEKLNLRDTEETPQHLEICADVTWLDNERNFKQKLHSFHEKYERQRMTKIRPIPLAEMFQKMFLMPQKKHKCAKHLFWRMKIAVPEHVAVNTKHNKLTAGVIVKKFCDSSLKLEDVLSKNKDKVIYRDCFRNGEIYGHVSVKCLCPELAMKNMLLTTSCLMFIIEIPKHNRKRYWEQEYLRLRAYLETHMDNNHKPVVFVVAIGEYGLWDIKSVTSELRLTHLQTENLVRKYHCLFLDEDTQNYDDLEVLNTDLDNMTEMVIRDSEVLDKNILSKQLSSFVEDGMTKLFFNVFHRYCLHCKKLELPIPNPADVVIFYNNCIAEVASAIFNFSLNVNEDTGNEEFHDNNEFTERIQGISNLVMKLKLPEFSEDYGISNHENCSSYIEKLTSSESVALISRVNTVVQQYNQSEDYTDTYIFPWPDVLELCMIHALGIMYNENVDNRKPNFTSAVHYQENIWELVSVENPLKQHMKVFNTSLHTLNESGGGNQLKRRKYEREYKLRDSIESTSDELSDIEDAMRRRKSRRTSYKQSSPLQEVVNESFTLLQDIHKEKQQKLRTGIRSSLNPFAKSFVPNSKRETLSKHDGLDSFNQSISLEDSVLDCLKSIDVAHNDWKSRNKYWQNIINQ